MGTARLVSDDTFFFSEKARARIRIWRVEKDERFPDGFKYSFVFLFENKRMLAYDNYEGKGHHRHYKNTPETKNPRVDEIKCFKELEKLRRTFMEETKQLRIELGDFKKRDF